MSKHLQSLLGFKPRSPSQDPDRPGSAKAETPRTTKKIQETLDWQTLNNHFDRYGMASGPASGAKESCLDMMDSGHSGKTTKKIQETLDWQTLNKHLDQFERTTSAGHDMKECGKDLMESTHSGKSESRLSSSSTQQLEKELLVRKFLEAHAEVGRRALEVREAAHQLGDNDNEFKRELQIYELLMKDSTELFGALSQKLSRLRSKMEPSSSVHRGKQRCQGRSSPTTEPTDYHRDENCTQQRSWVQPKAPEQASSHVSFHRRAASARHGGRTSMRDESKLHQSGIASQPVQRRPMSQTRYVHEPQSKVSAGRGEAALSEVQSRTLGDLPIIAPEDLLRLDQPSTLPDLPKLDMEA